MNVKHRSNPSCNNNSYLHNSQPHMITLRKMWNLSSQTRHHQNPEPNVNSCSKPHQFHKIRPHQPQRQLRHQRQLRQLNQFQNRQPRQSQSHHPGALVFAVQNMSTFTTMSRSSVFREWKVKWTQNIRRLSSYQCEASIFNSTVRIIYRSNGEWPENGMVGSNKKRSEESPG